MVTLRGTSMTNNPMKDAFDFYRANQSELLKTYKGKVLVIVGHEVIGAYNSELEALSSASVDHQPGTFLIQRCEPGGDNFTQVYHSRACFV